MNTLKSSIFLFIFLISPLSVAQTTYICLIHGKPAYTTIKQDATCKPSIINGISETDTNQFAPPIQVASNVALPAEAVSEPVASNDANDAIAKIWTDYEYGSYDRTPILPPPTPRVEKIESLPPVTSSHKTQSANKNTAPIVHRPTFQIQYKPSVAPVMSRHQVLNQEIQNEQAALKAAQSQLEIAKKRNNMAAIYKISNIIRERQQNIQSLQREFSR